ncbi:hypothetical protein ACX0G9_01910 [Flavitalea flava]
MKDKIYKGTITPSGDTDKNGVPVYFRVVLENNFFAYLCCDEIGWQKKDDKDKKDQGEIGDEGLIKALGEFIKQHYSPLK